MSALALSTSTTGKSLFTDRLPPEIRREIYKLLLVNAFLGTFAAVDIGAGRILKQKLSPKYDLFPNILRTCRKIYDEASEILYAQHFVAYCANSSYRQSILVTPFSVIRLQQKREFECSLSPIPTDCEVMQKVRSWTIIFHYKESCIHQFEQFCRIICDSRPHQVNVVLWKGTESYYNSLYAKPFLQRPLADLRNIGLLTFNKCMPLISRSSMNSIKIELKDKNQRAVAAIESHICHQVLKKWAEGSSPVERSFEMYHNLAKFVLSFEIHIAFKLSKPSHPRGKHTIMVEGYTIDGGPQETCIGPMYMNGSRDYPYEHPVSFDLDYGSNSIFNDALQLWAPLCCPPETWGLQYCYHITDHSHTIYDFVDEALECACNSALIFDNESFKTYRGRIVRYLSPRFNRISAACKEVHGYLQKVGNLGQQIKTDRQLPIEVEDGTDTKVATLILLIKNYAASFGRHELPDGYQDFPRPTQLWEREILLAKLDSMLHSHNYTDFDSVVADVLIEMDGRLAEIRLAGKHLFDADGYNDWRCDVEMNFLTDKEEGKT